jgi:hypothetical protein
MGRLVVPPPPHIHNKIERYLRRESELKGALVASLLCRVKVVGFRDIVGFIDVELVMVVAILKWKGCWM